ncbi:MAG: hypothetical protein EA357_01445 [Micavibrio sp.]|nr:MAG: hypothetical protein EA357_01445 [Micavibrio sp.]
MSAADSIVEDYEVFTNDRNAIAFFLMRHHALDENREKGPFLFAVQDGNNVVVGTEEHHAIFMNVTNEIIAKIKQRSAILLVEFEDQAPFRCTPCYLSPNSA